MKIFFKLKGAIIALTVLMLGAVVILLLGNWSQDIPWVSSLAESWGDQDQDVILGTATRSDLVQRVTVAGTVVPIRRTLITAPYNGYVKKIFVKVGQEVKTGDPLVTLTQSLSTADLLYPLRAPFPGTVVQIDKFEGDFVREGDTKDFIMRIDDRSQFYVLSSAPEIDWVKMRLGQEVMIKASAILDRTYKGVIDQISLSAMESEQWGSNTQVEFPVRVRILDADENLGSGMSVVMDILIQKREKALTLRHEFLHREGDQTYVIMKDGRRQPVKVGLQNEEASEILSGLKEGDVVRQIDFAQLSKD